MSKNGKELEGVREEGGKEEERRGKEEGEGEAHIHCGPSDR